jgi:hypothetical protein
MVKVHRKKYKQTQYEGLIVRCSPQAAAIGRREPYYMTYLRKYGDIKPPDNNT